jgi:hypothetical protein
MVELSLFRYPGPLFARHFSKALFRRPSRRAFKIFGEAYGRDSKMSCQITGRLITQTERFQAAIGAAKSRRKHFFSLRRNAG